MFAKYSRCLAKLWHDQQGGVLTTEVVLVGTVLGTGTLVGLVGLRDTVVHELGDLSQTLSDLNQAYSYSSLESCSAATAGSQSGDFNPNSDQVLKKDRPTESLILIDPSNDELSSESAPHEPEQAPPLST